MHIEIEEAAIFLSGKFENVTHLQRLAEGWWAQAFSFNCEKGEFVLRLSAHPQDFLKDKFAFEKFNRTAIPIARILETGPCYHNHYTLFHLHIHTARQEEKEYHHIARWAEKNLI